MRDHLYAQSLGCIEYAALNTDRATDGPDHMNEPLTLSGPMNQSNIVRTGPCVYTDGHGPVRLCGLGRTV